MTYARSIICRARLGRENGRDECRHWAANGAWRGVRNRPCKQTLALNTKTDIFHQTFISVRSNLKYITFSLAPFVSFNALCPHFYGRRRFVNHSSGSGATTVNNAHPAASAVPSRCALARLGHYRICTKLSFLPRLRTYPWWLSWNNYYTYSTSACVCYDWL